MERWARVDKHARTTRALLPPIPLNSYPPGSASHPAIPAGAGSNGVDWPARRWRSLRRQSGPALENKQPAGASCCCRPRSTVGRVATLTPSAATLHGDR